MSHQLIFQMMRTGCAMCFIGHGAFGIITKQIWCNYFAIFRIDHDLAYQLMPIVGVVDILMGVSLIIYPTSAIASWLIFWGLFTASLRPLSGEPFAEFLERAGNYGAPLLLLMLANASEKDYLKKLEPADTIDEHQWQKITRTLQIVGFTLLTGHGWLNLIGKAGLLNQYTALGFQHSEQTAFIIGCFEILGALIILLKPVRQIVLVLFIWKVASELFYPRYEIFEWIERGGSYMVLLALWFSQKHSYQEVKRSKNSLSGFASMN